MRNLTRLAMGIASLVVVAGGSASAALVTNPDDPRTWQGASVGTFAALYYGSDNLTTRTAVISSQLLDDAIINTTGWVAGSLISGGGGCLGTSTDLTGTGDFNYFCGGGAVSTYANAIDNLWFQTSGLLAGSSTVLDTSDDIVGGTTTGGTVFDLGFSANKAAIFNSIDHGPFPQEAIESTVYLSNDPSFATYVQAVVERVYLEGFQPNLNILWDGFSYIVGTGTSATFRYASVVHGGPGSLQHDGDNEINGIMGLRADNTGCTIGVNCDNPGEVPEPFTLSLLGAGLFGIGALRRRRA